MDLTTVLIFFLIFLLCTVFINSRRPPGLPPGPATLPFLGNLNLVYNNTTFHLTLNNLYKKHGGLFSLQMGYQPAVVISDIDIMREALIKKAEYFSNRPLHLLLVKAIFRGNGLVFQNGKKWEHLRRMVISSMRDFGVGKATLEDRVQEECVYILEEIEKSKERPFDPKYIFQRSVCNVICCVLFGKRFKYTNNEFNSFLDDLSTLFGNGVFQNCAVFLHSLGLVTLFLLKPSIAKMVFSTVRTRQFARRRVQEHRETFDMDNIRDFVDIYLEAQHKTDAPFKDDDIFQSIMDVFFAGTETTSTTLLWTFLFLIRHPHVQEKCRQEILKVVGQNRMPNMKDKEHLPYLEATTREIMRIGLPTPIAGLHNTAETTELAGYTIPKNTVVITNYYSLHMDPKLWPEPDVFRPERFLDDDGMLKKMDQYMPFGIGKRKCMGDNLAKMELFLVISSLLQQYRFRAKSPDSLPGVDQATMGVTLVPPFYEMIAEKL